MLDVTIVSEATAKAAAHGYVRIPRALEADDIASLMAEAERLVFAPLEPVVGNVRQSGAVARLDPCDRSRPVLEQLTMSVRDGVRRSGVEKTESFEPNEAMVQRYQEHGADGISAHRDQSFYAIAVVVFTLEGHAPFWVLDPADDGCLEQWLTEPGDMCVLAGGGLGGADRWPRHQVGPPVGGPRTSLTLRMKVGETAVDA